MCHLLSLEHSLSSSDLGEKSEILHQFSGSKRKYKCRKRCAVLKGGGVGGVVATGPISNFLKGINLRTYHIQPYVTVLEHFPEATFPSLHDK